MRVFFQCQIQVCDKMNEGCIGITVQNLKQNPCNIRRSQGRGRTRDLKCVLKGYLSVFYLYSTWRTRFWAFFRHFQLQVQVPGSGGQISKVSLIPRIVYQIIRFDELSRLVRTFFGSDLPITRYG
jgi:hypothetical protein